MLASAQLFSRIRWPGRTLAGRRVESNEPSQRMGSATALVDIVCPRMDLRNQCRTRMAQKSHARRYQYEKRVSHYELLSHYVKMTRTDVSSVGDTYPEGTTHDRHAVRAGTHRPSFGRPVQRLPLGGWEGVAAGQGDRRGGRVV